MIQGTGIGVLLVTHVFNDIKLTLNNSLSPAPFPLIW